MNNRTIAELISVVERHGYALLFFWVLAEQGALPIPSVPLLIAVGAMVRTGRLHVVAAMACCLGGGLLADTIWFHFGRTRGKRVLRFICRVSLEPDSCVRQTENAFLKHGLYTLLIAKFVPGLNAVAAPLAGDSGVGVPRFLLFDSLGIMFWCGTYFGVGYIFSNQVEEALGYAQQFGSRVLLLLGGLLAGWILWDRFTVHYTPTHGSWLNQAEIEIGIFSRQCLGHRRIPDLKTLRQETKAWNRRVNRDRVKIHWKFNRKTARRKFGYKPKRFKRSET